jgi:hypothetical protein
MLTFEVASFDIGYNCILGRPFLLKFMMVIHTTYATIKMPRPKGVITLKFNQHDTLACENAALTHVGWFGEKEAQELAIKTTKTHRGSTMAKMVVPKPPVGSTPQTHAEKKSIFTGSTSNHSTADQLADDKKKGAMDKDVLVDPHDADKKLSLSTKFDPK